MKEKNYQTYFEQNAFSWLSDGYSTDGYNYRTPANRLRVISSFLENTKDIHTAIDIGCGGGHISIELAKHNIDVCAVDGSNNMLQEAAKNISENSESIQEKITLSKHDFFEIPDGLYDCAVAMGLIGYLPSDESFFDKLSALVKKDGYVIVSFRNRLFNLFSISQRTLKECELGTISNLIKESEDINQKITVEDVKQFILSLNMITSHLLNNIDSIQFADNECQNEYTDTVEPRQTTPQEAIKVAEKFGFKPLKLVGVHPHFLVPKLNKCFPPGIYNKISDSLIPLEEHPVALLWSSVFIGIFKKE